MNLIDDESISQKGGGIFKQNESRFSDEELYKVLGTFGCKELKELKEIKPM